MFGGAASLAFLSHLHWVGADLLHFKRVDDPHGDIADQQESDHLATRLCPFVLRQMDTAPRHVCDEQQLEHNLKHNTK